MISVALKGLAGRKVRALLTALAIVIGISMVSGTYILTDTMQKSFDGLFAATYDKTDAVISSKEVVKGSFSGGQTIPASVLTKVQSLPEVESAGGGVAPQEGNPADILGADGQPVARESVAGSYDTEHPEFSPLKLKSGKWAEGPDQVVVDAGTAAKEHYKLGDTITISALGQTTVMVTHDAHAAAIADRVLFLADGDIVRDLGQSSAHEILATLEEVSGR